MHAPLASCKLLGAASGCMLCALCCACHGEPRPHLEGQLQLRACDDNVGEVQQVHLGGRVGRAQHSTARCAQHGVGCMGMYTAEEPASRSSIYPESSARASAAAQGRCRELHHKGGGKGTAQAWGRGSKSECAVSGGHRSPGSLTSRGSSMPLRETMMRLGCSSTGSERMSAATCGGSVGSMGAWGPRGE